MHTVADLLRLRAERTPQRLAYTFLDDFGMERERVAAYLASDEGAAEVREEIARAQRLGIRAVPTFILDGRFAVQGAQHASAFLQALEEAWAERREGLATGEGPSVGACADGACAT